MDDVVLGMPGPWAEDKCEASDPFTTKIGGLPDWPFPNEAIKSDLLECSACGSRLCLVAQVYAPISNRDLKIEERTIYVFGCVIPECGSMPHSWKAIRVQKHYIEKEPKAVLREVAPLTSSYTSVPETNSWWDTDLSANGFTEEDDDGTDEEIDLEELGKALSEAASVALNSKKQNKNLHQETVAKPLPLSPTTKVTDTRTPVLPCFYMYSQEEPPSKEVSSICLNSSIKENQHDLEEDKKEEKWEEEGYEYDRAIDADRTYLKFKKRMDAFPEQCFRYSYGGKPLLAKEGSEGGGTCKLCGGSRHYEMQLMPPLLYFLQEAAKSSSKYSLENWNWMTILVFTCAKSCSHMVDPEKSDSHGWIMAEEAAVVQFEEEAVLTYLS